MFALDYLKKYLNISHLLPFPDPLSSEHAKTQLFSYGAEDLADKMERFILTFINARQAAAQEKFVQIFKQYQYQARLQERVISDFTECLDEAFFMGLLTKVAGAGDPIIEKIEFGDAKLDKHASGERLLGIALFRDRKSYGQSCRVTIALAAGDRDKSGRSLLPLSAVLENLLHEMVHAFFMALVCYCPQCHSDNKKWENLGRTNHGKQFARLLDAMILKIRTWHIDLASFYVVHGISGSSSDVGVEEDKEFASTWFGWGR